MGVRRRHWHWAYDGSCRPSERNDDGSHVGSGALISRPVGWEHGREVDGGAGGT